MEQKRCLYCYQPLTDAGADFHERCSRIFFGMPRPPALNYDKQQMQELAKEIVIRSVAVTGVQPKLSLTIEKVPGDPRNGRFTIVGLWGSYILKPPTDEFPGLPENEDLTMHLSEVFRIQTAQHSLIRLKSGELAYLTKRFDRVKGKKLAMEDLCQLTGTLTEDKYRSSMEKAGKHIALYSSAPGLDAIRFFELALFCFITGNADMHLKNFALITTPDKRFTLSPAYDLLNSNLALPADTEEMALTINARKNKIRRKDFDALAQKLGIAERPLQNIYTGILKKAPRASGWVDISFLPKELKAVYKSIMQERLKRLEL
jgi:serine/threonine-protein kinase HipA